MSKKKYPFAVDYNDHFETSHQAYLDILPLLDAVAPPSPSSQTSKRGPGSNVRSDHIIYDPYYCDGRAKTILQSFGFRVQHEKRDFYKDVKENKLPQFHTLVTNPPYSEDHKERCVQFAMDQLLGKHEPEPEHQNEHERISTSAKPFFILMPNYVACRNHFRSAIAPPELPGHKSPPQILYVVPRDPYDYDHPEGTGKDVPPFASIWFCGIPSHMVDKAKDAFRKQFANSNSNSRPPRMASSLEELKALGAVPTSKRKNLKQRLKAKKKQQQAQNGHDATANPLHPSNPLEKGKPHDNTPKKTGMSTGMQSSKKRKSKYRDNGGFGSRRKKRF